MAYQLQPYATFLLGSQTGIPIPGWPYNLILDRLKRPHGALMAPPEFGSYAVRRFCASYQPSITSHVDADQTDSAYPNSSSSPTLSRWSCPSRLGTLKIRDRITELFFTITDRGGPDRSLTWPTCVSISWALQYTHSPDRDSAGRIGRPREPGPRGNAVGLSKEGEGWPLVAEHGRNSGQFDQTQWPEPVRSAPRPRNDPSVVRTLYEDFVVCAENNVGAIWCTTLREIEVSRSTRRSGSWLTTRRESSGRCSRGIVRRTVSVATNSAAASNLDAASNLGAASSSSAASSSDEGTDSEGLRADGEDPSKVAADIFARTVGLGGQLIVTFVAPISAFSLGARAIEDGRL